MQEFFTRLGRVLATKDMRSKHLLFLDLYEDFLSHKLTIAHHLPIESIAPYTCAPIKSARLIKQGKLESSSGFARALHAIAHIEYSAVTLALDSAYRFRHLPYEYYADWLGVAEEEFRHFFLLDGLLGEFGARYGDFAVHSNLYMASFETNASLLYRMGVVHRGLEARGLDANPFVSRKFAASKHPMFGKIDEVLQCILRDEIGHVSKGDRWWKFALCSALSSRHQAVESTLPARIAESIRADVQVLLRYGQLDSRVSKIWEEFVPTQEQENGLRHTQVISDISEQVFLALCAKFTSFNLCGKTPNTKARLQCGFSEREIRQLERFYAKAFAY